MTVSKKTTTDSLDVAKAIAHIKASIVTLREASEVEGAVTKNTIAEFDNLVEDLIRDLREVKKPFAKVRAVQASQKSRALRKERVDKALALLAAEEAKEVA